MFDFARIPSNSGKLIVAVIDRSVNQPPFWHESDALGFGRLGSHNALAEIPRTDGNPIPSGGNAEYPLVREIDAVGSRSARATVTPSRRDTTWSSADRTEARSGMRLVSPRATAIIFVPSASIV